MIKACIFDLERNTGLHSGFHGSCRKSGSAEVWTEPNASGRITGITVETVQICW